jgi:hypothetical protein
MMIPVGGLGPALVSMFQEQAMVVEQGLELVAEEGFC